MQIAMEEEERVIDAFQRLRVTEEDRERARQLEERFNRQREEFHRETALFREMIAESE